MSGEESPHPGLLAGSHRWVVPCAPDAAFGAVHGVAEELALPALALLVAGRGAGLHHFLICWRRAEGQSPGLGSVLPPGHVQVQSKAQHTHPPPDLTPAVWVSEEELWAGAESQLLRYTPNQRVHSFPQEDQNSPTRRGPRTVSPSIAGGFCPSTCEGLGPGAAPTSHVYAALSTGPTLCPHVNVTPPHGLCSESNTRGS